MIDRGMEIITPKKSMYYDGMIFLENFQCSYVIIDVECIFLSSYKYLHSQTKKSKHVY